MEQVQGTVMNVLRPPVELLRRHFREIIGTAAAAAVLLSGWMQAGAVVVVNAGALAALAWLTLDPWRLLSWKLCSRERLALAAAAALCLAGAELPGLPWAARGVVWAVSALLILIWWRNRALWRQDCAFLQSDEVNRTLEHFSCGGVWASGTAWERYGRAEVAAFTRQGLNEIVGESELDRLCRPAFLLGFTDGQADSAAELEKLRRSVSGLERGAVAYREKIAELQETLSERADNAGKLEELEQTLKTFRGTIQAQREEIAALRERLEVFEDQEPAAPDTVTDRNAQMLALHQDGMSYNDLAKRFGLSLSGAKTAIRRAKEAGTESPCELMEIA